MVDAGRMTATARRDIGACNSPTDKRGSGVAYRCVMTLVHWTAISIGSLLFIAPWAFDRYNREGRMAKKSRRCDQLPVLHPDAAGIDVGASELFVAVAADRDPHPVRSFPTFTRDLNALADWLEQCGIRSVAMESTSVL